MFQPVGRQRASVYWRRRLVLLGVVVVLLIVAFVELRPGGTSDSAAKAPPSTSTSRTVATTRPDDTSTKITHAPSSSKSSGRHSSTHTTKAVACTPAGLRVAAHAAQPTFRVGSQPVVALEVTNIGAKPCVQNLADSQVELQIYNGESRVWGSHDCEIQPGVAKRTLKPGVTVRVAITWSGLSSQPKCAGTRQRVGAGTYTIYAWLSGHQGTAAQFAMT